MIRSKRLASWDNTWSGGTQLLYTCPTGKVAIVRDLLIIGWSSGRSWSTTLKTAGGSYRELYQVVTASAKDQTQYQQLHLVLEAGDELHAYADNYRWSGYVSGYELTG